MNKKFLAMLCCLLLLGAVACTEDDSGNDPALRGLWNGFIDMHMGAGVQYTEIQVSGSTYELFHYDSNLYDEDMEITMGTMKGTYDTADGSWTSTITHMYDDMDSVWVSNPQDPMYQTYTITGTGVGAVLALVQTNSGTPETLYFTNIEPYSFDSALAGTWGGATDLGNGTMYITNVIDADGSYNRKTYMEMDALSGIPNWECFLSEEAVGTVVHNPDQSILVNMDTQITEVTNAPPATAPASETKQVFKRQRVPVDIVGNTLTVYIGGMPVVLTRN